MDEMSLEFLECPLIPKVGKRESVLYLKLDQTNRTFFGILDFLTRVKRGQNIVVKGSLPNHFI